MPWKCSGYNLHWRKMRTALENRSCLLPCTLETIYRLILTRFLFCFLSQSSFDPRSVSTSHSVATDLTALSSAPHSPFKRGQWDFTRLRPTPPIRPAYALIAKEVRHLLSLHGIMRKKLFAIYDRYVEKPFTWLDQINPKLKLLQSLLVRSVDTVHAPVWNVAPSFHL